MRKITTTLSALIALVFAMSAAGDQVYEAPSGYAVCWGWVEYERITGLERPDGQSQRCPGEYVCSLLKTVATHEPFPTDLQPDDSEWDRITLSFWKYMTGETSFYPRNPDGSYTGAYRGCFKTPDKSDVSAKAWDAIRASMVERLGAEGVERWSAITESRSINNNVWHPATESMDSQQQTSATKALIDAAVSGTLADLRNAIREGADINAKRNDAEGATALMWAAYHGDQAKVVALLEAGADADATDNQGDTAIDEARRRGHAHIVGILQDWDGRAYPTRDGR